MGRLDFALEVIIACPSAGGQRQDRSNPITANRHWTQKDHVEKSREIITDIFTCSTCKADAYDSIQISNVNI